jgi:hypothetical protein
MVGAKIVILRDNIMLGPLQPTYKRRLINSKGNTPKPRSHGASKSRDTVMYLITDQEVAWAVRAGRLPIPSYPLSELALGIA